MGSQRKTRHTLPRSGRRLKYKLRCILDAGLYCNCKRIVICCDLVLGHDGSFGKSSVYSDEGNICRITTGLNQSCHTMRAGPRELTLSKLRSSTLRALASEVLSSPVHRLRSSCHVRPAAPSCDDSVRGGKTKSRIE